VGERFKPEVC